MCTPGPALNMNAAGAGWEWEWRGYVTTDSNLVYNHLTSFTLLEPYMIRILKALENILLIAAMQLTSSLLFHVSLHDQQNSFILCFTDLNQFKA